MFVMMGIEQSFAEQASGKPAGETNSDKVCGDKLCSEIQESSTEIIVPPIGRPLNANLRVVDMFGNSLDSIDIEQQVFISADLANSRDRDQPFVFLIQIQDRNGITVSLDWITGILNSGQSFSPATSWIPTKDGTYTATAFYWESIVNPTSFSPPVSTTINVIGLPDPNLKKIELSDIRVRISHNNEVFGGIIDINDMDKFYGFSILGKIENRNNLATDLTFVTTIKDENQDLILIRYNTKTISGDRSELVGVNWLPDSPGIYYIDTFVWNNLQDQEIIHDPVSIKIQLVDETNSYTHTTLDFNSTYELNHQNQSYNIQFKNMGAHLTEITKDESIPSLTLTLEKAGSGWLNIAIPRNLLDAKIIEGNDFIVKMDGLKVPHNEAFEETQRILDININRGNEEIEITPVYLVDATPNENINEKSQKPILVRDTVCQNGVFFEDPLNILNNGDRWFPWNYLDCVYPEQLKHDLSNYDFISHEDGMKMLGVYSESDGIIERKVDFRPRLVSLGYCNPVYYHVYEYPKRVEIGQEFFINVTYSWIQPNDDWGNMSESDKNKIIGFGEIARPLEIQDTELVEKIRELMQNNIDTNQEEINKLKNQKKAIDDKIDSLYDKLVSIVEKYDGVNISTIDELLDSESTNTTVGFDKKQKNEYCKEPYIQLLVPKQMNFVNTDMVDSFAFSSYSDRNIAEKSVSFNNTSPQKQSFSFVVTEQISDLYEIVEIGINLETDNIFTISTDKNYVYFGDNEIYHHQESHQGHRSNERGPVMLLYAEYLQENYPSADKSFIVNDLDIGNKKALQKYVKIFLEEYPEFNK